jgi:hypothetical protein
MNRCKAFLQGRKQATLSVQIVNWKSGMMSSSAKEAADDGGVKQVRHSVWREGTKSEQLGYTPVSMT